MYMYANMEIVPEFPSISFVCKICLYVWSNIDLVE